MHGASDDDMSGIPSPIEASKVMEESTSESASLKTVTGETEWIQQAIKSTSGIEWLKDTVLETVLSTFHSTNSNVHVLDTVFIDEVSTKPKQIKFARKSIILVPLHQNKHWTVSVIYTAHNKIEFYDSLADKAYTLDAQRRLTNFMQNLVVKDAPLEQQSKLRSQFAMKWAFREISCCTAELQ